MKDYATKLAENESATKRWLTRLKRASNKLDGLRRQRVNLLRAQSKALTKEADQTEKTATGMEIVLTVGKGIKSVKKTKPERRINL